MDRRYAGAIAWVLSAVVLPVQLVVALRWPEGYSVTANAISDLGVTECGQFDEGGGEQRRPVCSPWHGLFNTALVVSGLLVALGAALLHRWWPGRSGHAGTTLLVIAGGLVAVVGLAPWDTHPALHDMAALGQAAAQWLAMGLLAAAAGAGAFRRVTMGALVLSVAGFAAFVAGIEGAEVPIVGLGGAERLSFDTLTLWTAGAGVFVLARRHGHVPDPAPRPIGARDA
ncbi:DUF998 domain-containing protein [Aquipuribacter hungaricus]|uniref:DUF998 domain-containing protein n=1 Tax=Aquipuribacter hungaricus TaxID=545624 RepID=A0ABV7WK62_9MICO